ncbi:MAG: hypothetical protein K0V04_44915 [Deltaproteobacteria bacterium]|nr:hypothetical protein [Deltaproteobacteria bacterium]
MSVRRLALASLLLPGLGTACAMDLPISERIINVRPLAMRVEVVDPAAPEDEAIRAEALPVEAIRVVPFIVDDQGPLTSERIETELEPLWLACPLQPGEGIFACLSGELPLVLDDIEDCPPVDFAALDPESGALPEIPAPCRVTGGTPSEPSMQVPLDFNFFLGGDLELTMIGHRPEAGDTERCAQAVLGEEPLPTECLVSVQRASIGPDAAIARLAADAGLGDALGPIPSEDDVPDADRHPRIQTFRVIVTDETDLRADDLERIAAADEGVEVARGDTLMVTAGQSLVIETTAPAEDLQVYTIPIDDGQFEDRDEFYAGNWYRTWGTLLGNDSDDAVSYNVWSMLPGEQDDVTDELPPDGMATLFYVLRDNRQGVDWWWVNVQVQ